MDYFLVNTYILSEHKTDSLLIIDGRSDEMFQSGHLPNAINIDAYKENLEEQLTATVIPHKHLFIYCTRSTRSDSIINTLSQLGYKGCILQMSDGISGWKAHEFELIIPEACKENEAKETDQRDSNH